MKRLFTYAIFFLAFYSVHAQWTTETDVNTLVATSVSDDMKALGTSNGMTYVVFWKPVPPPTNYELRMQVLDFAGNRTLGDDGILVSSTLPMSTFTVIWNIVLDDDDNLYIGVTGTGGGDPAYVFKLDTAGNHVWSSDGINVGSGNLVTVLPLSTGGAIVVWLGGSGGLMQRLDSNGNIVWPSDQTLEPGLGTTAPANLFELSNGDYITIFHLLIGGINSHLYAQRFDEDGNSVWGAPVQIANQATAFNRSYDGVQDGDVVYMGYYGSTGVRFDSFLQRINPDGSLPWGINGSDFDTNQTDYEMETTIAMESNSDYVWSMSTYRDPSQNNSGEKVQKFNKATGSRELTDTAKQVYAIGSSEVHAGQLQLKEGTPLFLRRSGVNNGVSPLTLDVVYLDTNGDFAWPEESKPMATFEASKSRIHYLMPVNHQSVAVFVEDKGDGNKVYAQNVLDEELGITEWKHLSLEYNNPIQDVLMIRSSEPIQQIEVHDILGKAISVFNVSMNYEVEFSAGQWNAGIYLIKVTTETGRQRTIKLLKD